MKKILLILIIGVFLICLASADNFGYNYLEGELNVAQAINYSQVNVNNSQYWDGNAWNSFGHWIKTGSDIYFNTGDVGIGTSTPSAKLEVSGGLAAAYGSATGDQSVGLGGDASVNYAIAIGADSLASNSYAIALGKDATASSQYATALGAQSSASGGDYASAFGSYATASGSKSVAIGRATASSTGAIVIGSHIGPGHFKCVNNVANSIMLSIGGSYPEVTIMGSTGNSQATTGRVGIGTKTPATSAKLDITSTNGALLLPRMTTAQKNTLTAVNGMLLYDTTLNQLQGYENGVWRQI